MSNRKKNINKEERLGKRFIAGVCLLGGIIGYGFVRDYLQERREKNSQEIVMKIEAPREEISFTNMQPDSKNTTSQKSNKSLTEIVAEPQKKEKVDVGIVTCSNQNYLYAQENLKTLKSAGYKSSYIQSIDKDGKTFYRTVVGASSKDIEKIIADLKKKDYFDTADKFFVIQGQVLQALAKETPKQEQQRVAKIEQKFKQAVEKTPKSDYIDLMNPFITKTYSNFTGHYMPSDKANEIAGYIYDSAKKFKAPLSDFTALIAHESKFTNQKGDEWSWNNYSEGYCQMRKKTQADVFRWMKKAGVTGLPANLPKSIISLPKLQLDMSAFYFSYCLKLSGGDAEGAISMYNAGPGGKGDNPAYVDKVKTEKSKLPSKVTSF